MRRGFVCSVAALLAGTGWPWPKRRCQREAPMAQGGPPVVGGGGTPYSPLAPNGITPAPFGLSAGGPGRIDDLPRQRLRRRLRQRLQSARLPGHPALSGSTASTCSGGPKPPTFPSLNFSQPLGTVTVPQTGPAPTAELPSPSTRQLAGAGAGLRTTPGLSWKDQPGMRFFGGFWFDKDQTLGHRRRLLLALAADRAVCQHPQPVARRASPSSC